MSAKSFRFGFMPSFHSEPIPQIDFARKHFDFIEITYNPDAVYSAAYVAKLRHVLDGFPVLGHLHWGLDFSGGSAGEIRNATKQISVLSGLGAELVTVHPSDRAGIPQTALLANNRQAFGELGRYCRQKGLRISVENTQSHLFSNAEMIRSLLSAVGADAGLTLDTGHADLASEGGHTGLLLSLGRNVAHVHLHDTQGRFDHLPFAGNEKPRQILRELENATSHHVGAAGLTITLEMFCLLNRGRETCVPMPELEREKILLRQLRLLRATD